MRIAQHPPLLGEQLAAQVLGLGVPALILDHPREIVACDQGVRVLISEHPLPVGQQPAIQLLSLAVPSLCSNRLDQPVTRNQDSGVPVAQGPADGDAGGGQLLGGSPVTAVPQCVGGSGAEGQQTGEALAIEVAGEPFQQCRDVRDGKRQVGQSEGRSTSSSPQNTWRSPTAAWPITGRSACAVASSRLRLTSTTTGWTVTAPAPTSLPTPAISINPKLASPAMPSRRRRSRFALAWSSEPAGGSLSWVSRRASGSGRSKAAGMGVAGA